MNAQIKLSPATQQALEKHPEAARVILESIEENDGFFDELSEVVRVELAARKEIEKLSYPDEVGEVALDAIMETIAAGFGQLQRHIKRG